MSSEHSVSQYIEGLREGDENASQKIWERFFERLIRLADRKLKSSPRRSMNEEDVVQQAFAEFFVQVQNGRFPKLNDRDDLWQVLAMLVDRRSKDQIRKQTTLKAGSGRVKNGSSFTAEGKPDFEVMDTIPDREPTPEEALIFIDTLSERLGLLRDDHQRDVALLKLRGHTNPEIVKITSSSLRSVERILNFIRSQWEEPGNAR